jgi:hypothetical protein
MRKLVLTTYEEESFGGSTIEHDAIFVRPQLRKKVFNSFFL